MDIKTLGVVVTGAATDRALLAAARDLAVRTGAHVDAVALGVEPVVVDAYSVGAVAVLTRAREDAVAEAEATAAAARAALAEVAFDVEPLVLQSLGLAEGLARRLRFADLVLSPRPYGRDRGPVAAQVAEATLFGAGVPLLALPDGGADLTRPWERVCLGWNDGDEALRAARAALPLLREAGRVDVAVVDPPAHAPERADPGGSLALWLARHGVRAEVSVLARTEPSVAGVLTRFARERGAEAIVMGAFGHSRLREAVLGGATRDLLAAPPLPLVLAR